MRSEEKVYVSFGSIYLC